MSAISEVSHLVSDIRDVLRGRTEAHTHLRNRLVTALTITLLVDLGAATLLYHLEANAKGSDISTWWDSFYFITAQLTTLSSSMGNPVTFGGEVLCLVIDIYAITVVAAMAGIFGGFFAHRTIDLKQQQQAKASSAAD